MGEVVPVIPELPPHGGLWPERFLINGDFVNSLGPDWYKMPNDDVDIRRSSDGGLDIRQPNGVHMYSTYPLALDGMLLYLVEKI